MDARQNASPPLQRVELLWDPRVLWKFWFEAMSQATDAYLRSAAFLQLMQHGLSAMSASQSVQDDTSRPPTPT
jgi:hypothetical protein